MQIALVNEDENFNCTISLNMPETDINSGNAHALYDRIGLYVQYRVGTYYYKTAIYTDIDLPLDNNEEKINKKEKIKELILDQYKRYKCILESE